MNYLNPLTYPDSYWRGNEKFCQKILSNFCTTKSKIDFYENTIKKQTQLLQLSKNDITFKYKRYKILSKLLLGKTRIRYKKKAQDYKNYLNYLIY